MTQPTRSNLIKVTADSRPAVVAGSVAHAVRGAGGETVSVQSIGLNASYNALKAAVSACRFLAEEGITVLVRPRFVSVEIEGEERTAIRLDFVVQRKRGGK